jgi:hypothetical protein
MNWLKILLGFSAIVVAGCAAYFSVTGLGVLFSGASIAVMIMAGSLEFAKLVSATYLKQKWKVIKGLNKWYLTSAVVILMVITSAGIFGFLSNAFQQQNLRLDQVKREISVWEVKIKSNTDQITSLTSQLNNLQSNQGKLLDNGKISKSLLKSVDNRDNQVTSVQNKISVLQDSSLKYNERINDIKNKNIGLEKEIGGFRFVAEAFNFELNSVVKFFIILIVIVFDPLALALVIAFNQMLMEKKDKKPEDVPVIPAEAIVGEISKVNLTDDDIQNLESILLKKQPVENRTEIQKKWDKIHEKYMNDDEPVGALANSEINEVFPSISDEEINEMNQDEHENYNGHELSNFEEEYIPTKEEEEQNFSTISSEIDDNVQEEEFHPTFEEEELNRKNNTELPKPISYYYELGSKKNNEPEETEKKK